MINSYYIYIITNITNNVLYIGVTNNLPRRIYEHKNGLFNNSFSKKYKLHKLVYCEEYPDIRDAIMREKQLKRWHREWKLNLIRNSNPEMDEILVN